MLVYRYKGKHLNLDTSLQRSVVVVLMHDAGCLRHCKSSVLHLKAQQRLCLEHAVQGRPLHDQEQQPTSRKKGLQCLRQEGAQIVGYVVLNTFRIAFHDSPMRFRSNQKKMVLEAVLGQNKESVVGCAEDCLRC